MLVDMKNKLITRMITSNEACSILCSRIIFLIETLVVSSQ